jgi:replication-associated recombination protein RarA
MNKELDPKKWKLYESALIKSIRRGLVDDAVYWATCSYKLGKEENVWRRLFIHLSEDIGLAEPNLPATIRALYENYKFLRFGNRAPYESYDTTRLPYIQAVMLMANSKKSRAVDNAVVVHFDLPYEHREPPDYAIDFHSPLGRRIGRDLKHFYTEAAYIENESDFEDKWKEKAQTRIEEI